MTLGLGAGEAPGQPITSREPSLRWWCSDISIDTGSEFMAEFEAACAARGIRLFVLPPSSPKLHGAVERANRTPAPPGPRLPDAGRVPGLNRGDGVTDVPNAYTRLTERVFWVILFHVNARAASQVRASNRCSRDAPGNQQGPLRPPSRVRSSGQKPGLFSQCLRDPLPPARRCAPRPCAACAVVRPRPIPSSAQPTVAQPSFGSIQPPAWQPARSAA